MDVEENAAQLLTAKFTTRSTKPVSYKPIPTPVWLLLPSERLQEMPFHIVDLPEIFRLDPYSARCSCGCGASAGVTDLTLEEIVIFTTTTAIFRKIETTYCMVCRNTKGRVGPDLGEFGIFNWNNRIAFSHELMNEYTSRFTTSMTPFFSFRQTIINRYMSQGSPRAFVSLYVFTSAYFGFVHIQRLETEMKCLHCKDEPPIVIADGVSISFSNRKVMGLKPPTLCDKEKNLVRLSRNSLQSMCFEGDRQIRKQFQDALELTKYEDVCRKLLDLMAMHQNAFVNGDVQIAIWECLSVFIEIHALHRKLTARFRQLLRQIFSNDSVLQIVQPHAVVHLRRYSTGDLDHNIAPAIPAFGMILQNLTNSEELRDRVQPCLQKLAKALADRSEFVFNNLISQRHVVKSTPIIEDEGQLCEWQRTGAWYGMLKRRSRPYYEGRDGKAKNAAENNQVNDVCNKYYETYKKQKLTGGLMAFWCPHLVCLGFHMMPTAEGRDDVFSAILTYWKNAPRMIIYDFACQLGPYCLAREPEFFRNTTFVIDEMHSTGHTNCSQAFFLQNYILTRASLKPVNSSAAECGNSGLARIRKSVSYMSESHAILYVHTYISVWNRIQARKFQTNADEQAARIKANYRQWKQTKVSAEYSRGFHLSCSGMVSTVEISIH